MSDNPVKKSYGVRVTIAALAFSALGFAGLANREGYRGEAYPDPVHGAAVPTMGFGTTENVRIGDKTDPVQAVRRAVSDVGKKEEAMKRCIAPDVALTQVEYDVYVDLAYNIGTTNFCQNTKRTGPSRLVTRLNAYEYAGACDAILLYKYAGGKDCSVRSNNCWGVWSSRLDANAKCRAAVLASVGA